MTDIDTEEPFRLASMAPKRRRNLPALLVAGAVVVMAVAGAAVVLWPRDRPAPAVAASAEPADEHSTCQQLNPILREVSQMGHDLAANGTVPDRGDADALRERLTAVRKDAPADMWQDMGVQLRNLALMPNGQIESDAFKESGIRLTERCIKVLYG